MISRYPQQKRKLEPGKTTSIWAKPRRCHWPLKKNYEELTSVAAQHCPAGAVGIESDLPLTISSSLSYKDLVWRFSAAIIDDEELRGVIGLVDGSQSSSHLLAFTVGGQKSMQIEQ